MAVIDKRPVFFFDIDNCLYPRSSNIHDEMFKLITQFISKHLALDSQEATVLQERYYNDYGLALEGLTRHHKIDPMVFNHEVDDALPLDSILRPSPTLRALLLRLDRSKVKPWLLTNAYISHAARVLKLLGIDDLFEGITYCDYGSLPLEHQARSNAILLVCILENGSTTRSASLTDLSYLTDDSYLNCKHAHSRGWNTAHLVEPGLEAPQVPASKYLISTLEEISVHFCHLFKP
ncbi:HAD-superfamily hydrolase subfamily IA variant 3 [Penicillium expansum]|nr:HAD-superfamily hydrolase subfamily IA variant 3 [Penicillium expansum]